MNKPIIECRGLQLDVLKRNKLKSLDCQLCNFIKTFGKNVLFADLSFLKPYSQRKVQEKPTSSTFFEHKPQSVCHIFSIIAIKTHRCIVVFLLLYALFNSLSFKKDLT